MKTHTPVLFITFARLDYARKTFDAIKSAKPEVLYFYSNKARSEHSTEVTANAKIREFVDEIDWKCDLHTFFRDEYVDVYTSLWGAMDWIFNNEEQAIVLEEDCVPSIAFFDYCAKLLERYKDDKRIWVLSGNNFIEGYNPNGYDYFFSYFPFLYGWASWSDRWKSVYRDRLPYEKIEEYKLFNQIYVVPRAARQALKFTKNIVDTPAWDYRFQRTMKCNGGLGVIPRVNLVSNIGLSGAHNNSAGSIFHNRPLPEFEEYDIENPPPFVVSDFGYTRKYYSEYYLRKKKFWYRLKRKILNSLR
jgi:hypothetical protein